ncbi:aromatic acid exporter family protein [Nocardioides sp. S-58]|uniref:Aromatic acid exporter family protein n=1 Tax=Nocardioides renjunii TaxID=3095075 RepID=A0ABU5K5Q6_9ACTN|nr:MULTISPECIES: aromatic acid exporter family protein [unclassified Nocardioides]MDZ5660217.1 aromatic acid exporter family protein [Nocardioides sp. S-58]WQQ21226.1 aromatic acid exporter family protein [Nocardioides sp. S-34]
MREYVREDVEDAEEGPGKAFRPSREERLRERINDRLGDPIWWNDLLQLGKTVLAAVAAWVLAASVLDLPQPFLAPWAALLVVHATVYRTLSNGTQQVAATVVAVLLATVVGEVLGLTTGAIALLLVVALLLGAVPWLGAEATTIATTGLVVLTTGFDNDTLLVSRLLDTAVGVAVGLLVNVMVWPPLGRHAAAKALDRVDEGIGELLVEMADGLGSRCGQEDVDGWVDRTRDIDEELDHAWALVRQAQESARMNPRRSARAMKEPRQWHGLLRRMEQAVAETRSLARTLGSQQSHRETWGEEFSRAWIGMLRDAGRAAVDADPEGMLAVRARLVSLSDDLRRTERSAEWAIYGALIINLRNIVDSMDVVAEANPIGGPTLPLRIPARRRPVRG